jgi:SAM-dependent methyltransferase
VKQNIYDNPQFFAGYRILRETRSGLNEALEQPALRSLLPPLRSARVLDLGCGFGDLCQYTAERGASHITGIDISRRMLEIAGTKTRDARIDYLRCAVEDYQYRGPPIDLVVSSLMLHYVRDYPAIVSRVSSWLAPGGRFVFSVEHPICTALLAGWYQHNDGSRFHWPVDRYREEGERRHHWFVDGVIKYHRTVETYVNTLLEAGLTIERLLEPEPTGAALAERPELADDRRRPPFLIIAARRPIR